MILDDVYDEARHRIESLEGIAVLARSDALGVAANTAFRADAEEERRHIFHLENALLRQLIDEGNERLLRGV